MVPTRPPGTPAARLLRATATLLVCGLLLAAAPRAQAGFNTGQIFARVAFNPIDNQYLVVYLDGADGGSYVGALRGKIVASDGTTPVVPEFTISSDMALSTDGTDSLPNPPAVAFDPSSKRYLVVWTRFDGSARQIVGRLVNADGSVSNDGVSDLDGSGGAFTDLDAILISESADVEHKEWPVVAADPNHRRFLVAWRDDETGIFEILGRMVNAADGTLHAGGVSDLDANETIDALDAIEIAYDVNDLRNPALAFDPASERYLAVWAADFSGALATIDPASGAGRKRAPFRLGTYDGFAIDPNPDGNPATDDAILYGVNGTDVAALDRTTGAETVLFATAPYSSITALEFSPADGKLLATDINTGNLLSIDPQAQTLTTIREGLNTPSGLAYDPSGGGTLYGVDNTKAILFSIDPATGLASVIGPLGASGGNVTGLAFGGGVLYGISRATNPNRLITIDTSAGTATVVGTNLSCTDPLHCNQVAGLAYNPDGNLNNVADDPVLYTVNSWVGDHLVTIDPATGAQSAVFTPAALLPTTKSSTSHPTATDFEAVLSLAFDPDPNGDSNTSDGKLYAVEINNDHLAVIDPLTISNSFVVAVLQAGGVDFRGSIGGLAFIGHTLYGVDGEYDQLVTIATGDATTTPGGVLGLSFVRGLALHPITGVLYGGENIKDRLLAIDRTTGAASVVGPLGFGNVGGLAFDPDPNKDGNTADAVLYGTDVSTNTLIRIDTSTGAGTAVGATGDLVLGGIQGLAFDPAAGTLYGGSSDFESELPARLIGADGSRYDPDPLAAPDLTDPAASTFISLAPGAQEYPAATYDPANGRFVVVWRDGRDNVTDWDGDGLQDWDIAGQFVDGQGRLLDPDPAAGPDLTDPFVNFPVYATSADPDLPAVTFDTVRDRLWAVWTNYGTTAKINYTSVEADTLMAAPALEIAPAVVQNEDVAAAAANPFCRNVLFAYTVALNNGELSDAVIAHPVNTACAPSPGLLWPATGSGTAPRQVGPLTAASGTTATFAVDYYSAANTAPTVHELWIDMNSDGVYAAPLAGAVTGAATPAGRGGFPPAAAASAAAGLGGLLLLGALLARQRPRLGPALMLATVIYASGLLTSVAITGCRSSDDAAAPTQAGRAPGVTPTGKDGLSIAEGSSASFDVTLAEKPTASVTVGLSSSDTTEGTIRPASLTFTAVNWNTAQTVTVTGVQDNVIDGPQTFTIVTAPSVSKDAAYNGIDAPDVPVTTTDSGLQERYTMSVDTAATAALHDGNYANGERYKVDVAISGPARGSKYRFAFSDGVGEGSGAPARSTGFDVTAAP